MKLKRILAGVFALTIITSISGCTTETSNSDSDSSDSSIISDSQKDSKNDDSSESETEKEKAEFEFAIKSTSLSKDYEDKDVLIVEYDFTNNSSEATSFTFACQDTVFQDGVECDSTVIGCDEVDTQDQLNDIQPGKTYSLKVGYHITDKSMPADIIVTDLFGKETFLEESIDLNDLQ